MKKLPKQELKQVLVSIFIGASVAFFTSFFEGLLVILKNNGNDIVGGIIAGAYHISKHTKIT